MRLQEPSIYCLSKVLKCLALDCLLASDGEVCGKFNLSNFCLQIDDEERSQKK
jgi:hypothetical protein